MESTKRDPELDSPTQSLLSDEESLSSVSSSTNQETSASSTAQSSSSKRPPTVATSAEANQIGSASTESRTESPSLEQQAEASPSSGRQPNSSSTSDSLLLSKDPFGSEQSKALFDAIDELRICGAGQDLDLPQLVIVGQQSAGKSSLLQSLTDIPFPVGGGLCTRFATRIISRRTEPGTPEMIHISIEPGDLDPFGYHENEGPTGNFNPAVPSMTAEVFKGIVKQASRYMGILEGPVAKKKNFSSQVLKIELSGPSRSHFGILDVPGVFSAPINGITTEEMAGVTKMVTSYMKKPQNVIICVAPATEDLSNQTILNLIKSEDIDNSRVVGVFTKIDRTTYDEAKRIVQTVRENKGVTLQNGWFVVQNRGLDPASRPDREEAERPTLSKRPWVDIPEQQRGTARLKAFLANILCRRIREAFPDMHRTIAKLLAAEKHRLEQLGKARPKTAQRREYLSNLAGRYNELAHYALKSPEELASDKMKLRGMAHHATEIFAEEMRRDGNFYKFLDIADGANEIGAQSSNSPFIVSETDRKTSLYNEIRTQVKKNRGQELAGMSNPAVLKPLFRKQTSKWQKIGQDHLESIVKMSQDVAMEILDEVCRHFSVPIHTKNALEDVISSFKDHAEREAAEKLSTFCHEITTFPLQTTNSQFLEKVTYAQHARFRGALERYRKANPPEKFLVTLMQNQDPAGLKNIPKHYGSWAIVDLDNIDKLFDQMHPRGVQNTEDEIHDLLKAYYEIALEDFLSHIQHRIVEPFFQDKHGPILGLSTNYINGLSEERIDMLGSEDEFVISLRKDTKAKIERLEEAMRIADQTWRRTKELEG